MKLRELQAQDADGMKEWILDADINQHFQFDPAQASATVLNFIENASNDEHSQHFAVVNENDDYLGTVSLKNIDVANKNAEYAISMRRAAMGTGAAAFATNSILEIAFNKLNLHRVYLNVLSDNKRAVRFYEKTGFHFEGEFKEHLCVRGQYKNLKWYRITKEEFSQYNK